jgi:hypothetical protein
MLFLKNNLKPKQPINFCTRLKILRILSPQILYKTVVKH